MVDNQLQVLGQYRMDVEVCGVGYSRPHYAWRTETTVEGSLGNARWRSPWSRAQIMCPAFETRRESCG